MTKPHEQVFICPSVRTTGLVWSIVGIGMIAGCGVLLWARAGRDWAPSLALGIAGLILSLCGISFLQARIAVGDHVVTAWWALTRVTFAVDDLVTATIAPPRKFGDRAGGPSDWMSPGFIVAPGVILTGYVLKWVFNTLAWVAIPGSSHDQVLHLVPRFGGSIPLSAISTRTNHPNDEAHRALGAVVHAIDRQKAQTHAQRNVHEVPLAWSEELPPFSGSRDG